MPTKWQVTRAVRGSGLKSTARLIMFVLADRADAATAVIPDEHTPSLRELADESDLDKSTVTRWLNTLEAAGWIARDKPTLTAARTEHERTRYRLLVAGHGAQDTMPGADDTMPMVQETPSHGAQDTKGMVQGAPVLLLPDHSQITNNPSSPKAPKPPKNLDRPDVELVCNYLANRIEANGSKRPKVTDRWRTEARLMLDVDKREVEKVIKAIDWCQADPFWRTNILSMPKLREKYDQLRLAAQRTRASPGSGLVEHNGMKLRPETAARLADRARFEAMDRARQNQPAIGGSQ